MLDSGQEDLRANQKARTRAAIVEAAQQLDNLGSTPTVAEAAVEAGVSRATAYRYFPTQQALLVELTDVTPSVLPVEELLASLTTDDVEQRLLLLLDTFGPVVLAHEDELRRALWVYLDTWLRNRRNGVEDPRRFEKVGACAGSTPHSSPCRTFPTNSAAVCKPRSPSQSGSTPSS